jgi:glycosyltransferase involved in cell wall biosynthesis
MINISIIIPTYNRASTIEKAVQSILNQTYKYFEIIIVDDGSTDDTEKIMTTLISDTVKYIRYEKNKGACFARNTGIKNAQYELITFLDSDDVWKLNFLEKQIEFYNNISSKTQNFGLQFCSYHLHDNGQTTLMPNREFDLSTPKKTLNSLLEANFISTQTILSKKSILNNVNGFDELLGAYQDWDLALRIASKYTILHVNEPLVDVFLSSDSITVNYKKRMLALYHLKEKYTKFNLLSKTQINKIGLVIIFYKIKYKLEDDLNFNVLSLIKEDPFSIKSYYAILKFFYTFKKLR